VRTSRQVLDFRRDAIDLAIRFAPSPGRGLHAEMLCHEELFPVASPQLFGGRPMPDTLAALADYPLLHDTDAGSEQPWLGWRGWFERAGLPTANVGAARSSVTPWCWSGRRLRVSALPSDARRTSGRCWRAVSWCA
jgi:DNA-binding transcriptional LysR family regulator